MLPTLIYPPSTCRSETSYFSFDAFVWTLYMPIKSSPSIIQPIPQYANYLITHHPLKSSSIQKPVLTSLNNYLPGLLVSIYSTKKQHEMYPNIKYVVMLTHDVPEEAFQIISKFVDHIWQVRYITRPVHLDKNSKLAQRADIDLWINSSYTKYNGLALPYNKIVLLDCDTVCIGKLTPLLMLETPAACYANINHEPFGDIINYHVTPGSIRMSPVHGEKIPQETIIKSMTKNGTVFSGAVLVLSPNLSEFDELLKLLDYTIFASDTCLSKPDEQCLAAFYTSKKINITNIDSIYNASQYTHAYLHGSQPVLLHYPGIHKPWNILITDSSIKCWHKMADICSVVTQTYALKECTMYKKSILKKQQNMIPEQDEQLNFLN